MSEREFQYSDGKSHKFWRICLDGCTHTVQFGRIGTTGQTQTKSFATDAEARGSCEKLIQEKLKKGYVEVTATSSSPGHGPTTKAASAEPLAVSTASPSPAPAEDQPRAAAATTPTAGGEPAAREPTRRINLDPADWLWATWRPWSPLQRPEPKPFDLQEALARLESVQARPSGGWEWTRAEISPSLTRQEAHFWLAMMVSAHHTLTPIQAAERLAVSSFDGQLDLTNVREAIRNSVCAHLSPEAMLPLVNLLSLDELLDLMLDEEKIHRPERGHYWYSFCGFPVQGFRRYVWPFLTATEREHLRERLLPTLDTTTWPSDPRETPWVEFYLAACLGLHEEIRALVESWKDDRYQAVPTGVHWYQRPHEIIFGLGDPRLVATHMYRLRLGLGQPEHVRAWLAHTELAALGWIRSSIQAFNHEEGAEHLLEALALVDAPEAAPPMLELMLQSKASRLARHWLVEHPDHAIAGLVPVVAGRGRVAEEAASFLRDLRRRGHEDLFRASLAAQDREPADRVRAAVMEIPEERLPPFDEKSTPDWLQAAVAAAIPKKVKKPAWVDATDLPPIVVDQHCLNEAQIQRLLIALQESQLGPPHPLVAALREKADRTSLDAFAWKLFRLWQIEGAPTGDRWTLAAVGLLGSDRSALKLAPLIRVWPLESQHARAVFGLECLRTIGTDTALMQISGIAQKAKFKGLKAKALECMEAIAQERGLSRAELEDRIIPDCDLDDRGSRVLDFGTRQFHLVLGPDLKPLLRDEAGKLRPDLPKPTSKDDAERASAAAEEWKLLKKQVGEVAKIQAGRLEQAMVIGRRWPRDAFETLLARQPLMTHLVRRLVWAGHAGSGERLATFRVTEDGTYGDANDAIATLEGMTEVGIIHPLHLGEEERARWGELLSDYEIAPPFPQLGRPIYRLEPGEGEQTEITRFEHVKLPAISLVGTLERLGWTRAISQDHGWFYEHSKPFYGSEVTAIVQYEGVMVGEIVTSEDQRIEHCFFVPGIYTPIAYHEHKERVPLGQIDPVAISEVLNDLTTVAAKAR